PPASVYSEREAARDSPGRRRDPRPARARSGSRHPAGRDTSIASPRTGTLLYPRGPTRRHCRADRLRNSVARDTRGREASRSPSAATARVVEDCRRRTCRRVRCAHSFLLPSRWDRGSRRVWREYLACDNELLDLARAFIYPERANFAIQPLDGRAGNDSASAEQLDRAVHGPLGGFGCKPLGHRGFAGHSLRTTIVRPGRSVDQKCARIDVCRHRGDPRLRQLHVRETGAEHLAIRHVAQRLVECSAREAECRGAHGSAKYVERSECDTHPLAWNADNTGRGHPAIRERHRADRMRSCDVTARSDSEPRRRCVDDERDVPAVLRLLEATEYDVEVRDACVRYPALFPVDDIRITVARRRRAHRAHIRAGIGFRYCESSNRLAGRNAGKVASFELVGTEQRNRAGAQALQRKNEIGDPRV